MHLRLLLGSEIAGMPVLVDRCLQREVVVIVLGIELEAFRGCHGVVCRSCLGFCWIGTMSSPRLGLVGAGGKKRRRGGLQGNKLEPPAGRKRTTVRGEYAL